MTVLSLKIHTSCRKRIEYAAYEEIILKYFKEYFKIPVKYLFAFKFLIKLRFKAKVTKCKKKKYLYRPS